MNMLSTIDADSFHSGFLAEEWVNEHNQSSVVSQALPDTELTGLEKWRWVDSQWVACIDYRGTHWYDPNNTADVFSPSAYNEAPAERYVRWEDGQSKPQDQNEINAGLITFIIGRRALLLQESDWTDTLSAKNRLGETRYQEWQDYRQALRDITAQAGYPTEVIWPVAPV